MTGPGLEEQEETQQAGGVEDIGAGRVQRGVAEQGDAHGGVDGAEDGGEGEWAGHGFVWLSGCGSIIARIECGAFSCGKHREKRRPKGQPLQKRDRIADAEEFAGFGTGDAGVGGQAVEMVEARGGGVGGERFLAHGAELFLEGGEFFGGFRVARRDGAAGAGVGAFEGDFADAEAARVVFFGGEELVFPECRDAGEFESGAEAAAGLVEIG